jgi:hypothetical protein
MYFDEIVIGLGPSVVGYLLGCSDRNQKTAVINASRENTRPAEEVGTHPNADHKKLFVNGKKITSGQDYEGLPVTRSKAGLSMAWGGVLVSGTFEDYKRMFGPVKFSELDYSRYAFELRRELEKTLYLRDATRDRDGRTVFQITSENHGAWEHGGFSLNKTIDALIAQLGFKFIEDSTVEKIQWDVKTTNYLVKTQEVVYRCKRLVLGVGVPESKRLLEGMGVECSEVRDHTSLQIASFGRRKKLIGVESKSCGSPIVGIVLQNLSITSVYDPHLISRDGLKKVTDSKLALFLLQGLNVFGYRCFLLQHWFEKRKTDGETKFGLFRNALQVITACKSVRLVPFFFRHTKHGRGFHYQLSIDLGELPQFYVLGGAAARQLPFYHPSFMYMLHAFIVSRTTAK